jgi:hypothetical protein
VVVDRKLLSLATMLLTTVMVVKGERYGTQKGKGRERIEWVKVRRAI